MSGSRHWRDVLTEMIDLVTPPIRSRIILVDETRLPQLVGRFGLDRAECPVFAGVSSLGSRKRVGTRLWACRSTVVVRADSPVGMYLRETRRTNRDGSVVRYLQLAHNTRHPDTGVSTATVIHNFGRAEVVDRAALARLSTSR